MTTYIPWFLQEDGQTILQEDGELILIDGEVDPVSTGGGGGGGGSTGGGGGGSGPPGGLVWDSIGDRRYEAGLDRGVLYIPDGPAVPWNGLTSVVEKPEQQRQPIYFDGMKINDLVALGDFAATMKAITYPDEFVELEGLASAAPGMLLGNQSPKIFSLSYRTMIGDDILGSDAGYKIHILYNVTAIPSEKTYASLTDSPTLVEFEWDLTAVPEEIAGFRPTAHIIIDSTKFDPVLLGLLEDMLYGTAGVPAELIPLTDLIVYLLGFFSVVITDNGDGTWTAYSSQPVSPITFPSTGTFQIDGITGTYLDANTYQISNTVA